MAAPPTVQRKPVYNKGRGKWMSDMPALLNQTFVSKEAAEKAERTAKAAPAEAPKVPVTVDDGSGGAFEKVKSKEEEQQEARAAVDTAPLITEIDGHTGRANLMAVPFSQLVNAMEAQGTLAVGVIQDKYYDGAAGAGRGCRGKMVGCSFHRGAPQLGDPLALRSRGRHCSRRECDPHQAHVREVLPRRLDSPHASSGGSPHPAGDGTAGSPGRLTRHPRRHGSVISANRAARPNALHPATPS